MILKDNPDYYVCLLSSTNSHCCTVLEKFRGFSKLRKGDAFDFSLEGYYRADGYGATFHATSDYKHGMTKGTGTIRCEQDYDPEI
jgi:hypothetical protein